MGWGRRLGDGLFWARGVLVVLWLMLPVERLHPRRWRRRR